MFTVRNDNCLERGSPEAKAGGGGRREGAVVFQRKVIGVLEGLRSLPACRLRSPAPSLAVRAKRRSLQLAGRPGLRATGPAHASARPESRKGRCPRMNLPGSPRPVASGAKLGRILASGGRPAGPFAFPSSAKSAIASGTSGVGVGADIHQ